MTKMKRRRFGDFNRHNGDWANLFYLLQFFHWCARHTSQRLDSVHQPFGDWFGVTARITLMEKHLQ